MKILVTDFAWRNLEIEQAMLSRLPVSIVAAQTGAEDELAELATDADGILTNWKRVTRTVIAHAPKCRAIVRYGVGLDNIDVRYATEVGIIVANVPNYCIEDVSDHAMALLLALARKVPFYDRSMKAGIYNLQAGTPMYRLRDKTLGIIGFGKIGKMVCRKARGFGLKIIVHDHGANCKALLPENGEIESVNFSELLRRSDFLSIHVPLTNKTRHLFDTDAFRQMKPTAFLINTARGDIINSKALLKALDDGLIAGAALDVLSKEPPDPGDALVLHPRTIVTPHAAFNSEESLSELRSTASSQMLAALSGSIPEYLVNPAVLNNANLRANLQQNMAAQR